MGPVDLLARQDPNQAGLQDLRAGEPACGAGGRRLCQADRPLHDEQVHLALHGGLVPDVCQQFTKQQGVFTNPTSKASPAKLRLAFEAAPFGRLVEMAGGKTSDGVTGNSVLDTKIEAVDQRTALAIGSANEVDRFNQTVLSPVAA